MEKTLYSDKSAEFHVATVAVNIKFPFRIRRTIVLRSVFTPFLTNGRTVERSFYEYGRELYIDRCCTDMNDHYTSLCAMPMRGKNVTQ